MLPSVKLPKTPTGQPVALPPNTPIWECVIGTFILSSRQFSKALQSNFSTKGTTEGP